MSNTNKSNELATKDKQTSTALTVAQLSDSLPIKGGDVKGAVGLILESASQGKRAWIDTALKIRKVLAVERGKGQAVLDELISALKWSRSTVRAYQQAGNKLLTCKKSVDEIPDTMNEFMHKDPTAPKGARIVALRMLASYEYDKTTWAIFEGTIKENPDEEGKPFGFKIDKAVLPNALSSAVIVKQGSLIEGDKGIKRSIEYTLYPDGENSEGITVNIYPFTLG